MREKYEMYSVFQTANNYKNKVKQSAILMMRLRTEYTQPMASRVLNQVTHSKQYLVHKIMF
jgi:hypothetical protein